MRAFLFLIFLATSQLVATEVQVPNFCMDKEGSMTQNYTVGERPSMILVGIDCRTYNDPEVAPKDIGQLWSRFFSENVAGQIQNKASNEVICLYFDYEGDYTQPYTCVIGCPVSSIDAIPEGMVAKTLPASTYAVFQAIGEFPKAIGDTWGTVWQTKLNRTYTGDFEVYGENFFNIQQGAEVFIAIE